jgi:signal peptide peptidase-like protein 3
MAVDSPLFLLGAQTLSWKHIVCFPIVGSMSLIIFFFYFEFLQYIFSLSTAVISAVAIYDLVHPFVHTSSSIKNCIPRTEFVSVGIAVLASTVWMLTGHWMILDVLGSALSVLMMKYVRVPSLKHSTVLLIALLIYDVFWVFYSSSIFQANVMLEVATKTMDNPFNGGFPLKVAAVAKSLDMPDIAKGRPSLSIPGKLVFPSSVHDDHYAMLGLGDIILPGFLLCFVRRFDQIIPPRTQLKWTLCTVYSKLSYFQMCLLGYGIGLALASLASEYYQAAQPALLYLVPCTLIPLVIKAFLQGDVQHMWKGPFCEDDQLPPSTQAQQSMSRPTIAEGLPV